MTRELTRDQVIDLITEDAGKHGFQAVFIKDWDGKQGKLWLLSSCASDCAKSPGCRYCPVHLKEEKRRKDLMAKGLPCGRVRAKFLEKNIRMPLGWTKRHLVFVCNEGDLFHPDISSSHIAQVFAVMMRRPQDCYILLTKRATRLVALLCSPSFVDKVRVEGRKLFGTSFIVPDDWGHNILVGVSVEDQARMERATKLALLPKNIHKVLFVAPLLELVVLPPEVLACVEWVVCNRERGSAYCHPRPCDIEWIAALREQCKQASVPFFLEDRWTPETMGALGGFPREYPPILARDPSHRA